MSDNERIPDKTPVVIDTKKKFKSPFSPYDVIIIGLDDHPGIAADTRADPENGVTPKQAERRRKLYTQLFDERAFLPVDPGLLESVKAWGVQEPVKYIIFEGQPYLINGRQRIKAARVWYDHQVKLGIEPDHLITVEGVRYDGDIDDLFAVSRVLNIHVDEPPLMKARSMQRLLMEDIVDEPGEKPHKRTIQQVATIYGCSDQHVRDMTLLFASPDTVKQALESLKQPTIGLLLAGLKKDDGTPDEEAQAQVLAELKAEKARGGKVTVAGARAKIQAAKGKAVNSPKDKVESAQRVLLKLADEVDNALLPSQALTLLDKLVRTLWGGDKTLTFPTPINTQPPGYTLAIIANQEEK